MQDARVPVLRARRIARLAAALGVVILAATAAINAADYPNKPIRILVGFAPGGASDVISRVVGGKMGEILGVQFVVENKSGAGGANRDPGGRAIGARRLHAFEYAACHGGQ